MKSKETIQKELEEVKDKLKGLWKEDYTITSGDLLTSTTLLYILQVLMDIREKLYERDESKGT